MAKARINLLAGKLAASDETPKTFGLGDLAMLASGMEVPPGFPSGDIAPASVPESDFRKLLREKLAVDFVQWDHDTLARAAATLFEGSMMWRSVFAHYAKDKEIELRQTKSDLLKEIRDAQVEFLEVLDDPGTRAYLNAQAKLARDPVQAAKAQAFRFWQERRAGKHPRLRTNEQFAMECMRRWKALTSPKVILGWCTKWNKEARQQSQPAS